jgi:methyl-accepting chemotaxis protein
MRGLRISARLAVGFSVVSGLLFALVLAVAAFGHVQREALASAIAAATEKASALAELKSVAQDRAEYLRDLARADLRAALAAGGELTRLAREHGQALRRLEGAPLDAQERQAVANLAALERDYAAAARDVAGAEDDAVASGGFQSRAATSARKEAGEIEKLTARTLQGYNAPVNAFVERGRGATIVVLVLTLAIALLVAAVSWGITRGITRPLREAVEAVLRVSSGDLTGRVEARGRDEAADLLRAVQQMNARLAAMVLRIREGAAVSLDAGRVAEGHERLAQRTEEQASSLEESAATLEEFNTTVKQGADSVRQASELAGEAARTAREGGTAMREVVDGMAALADASRRIREIVGAIDAIAFQTNLLALNAAVEAARAGQEGRGFAVVASEVRLLAQRAASSSAEIAALVASSVAQMDRTAQGVRRAGGTIETLVGSVDQVSALMAAIANTSREQSTGIDQISQAIGQMDGVVQQNAALAAQASAATRGLDGQADALVEAVSSFRLAGEEADALARPPASTQLVEMPRVRRYASTGSR